MANSIAQKLKIKEGDALLTIKTPADFKKLLSVLPKGVTIGSDIKQYNQVHWFVLNRQEVEKGLSKIMKLLKENVIVWAYYPKGSSGVQTDLTRDKGWDCLLAESDRLTWISLISFNDTWSVFGFRPKTAADKKKEKKSGAPREIFNWVNPTTKEIELPDRTHKLAKRCVLEKAVHHQSRHEIKTY